MVVYHDLLDSECEDQNQLGMESLVLLTDVLAAVEEKIAEDIARASILGHDPYGYCDYRSCNLLKKHSIHWNTMPSEVLWKTFLTKACMMHLVLRALSDAFEV